MPSPTSKGKSSLATRGKLAVIGVIALMVVIYGTTFVMQVQACDQAISAIHSAYEKKLQFLRDSFTAYKQEHAAAPGGRRRRKRAVNLETVVAEMQAGSQEVRSLVALAFAAARMWLSPCAVCHWHGTTGWLLLPGFARTPTALLFCTNDTVGGCRANLHGREKGHEAEQRHKRAVQRPVLGGVLSAVRHHPVGLAGLQCAGPQGDHGTVVGLAASGSASARSIVHAACGSGIHCRGPRCQPIYFCTPPSARRETVKPKLDAEFDQPLSRQKYHQVRAGRGEFRFAATRGFGRPAHLLTPTHPELLHVCGCPVPPSVCQQLQRILQQFYVKITKKGYSQTRCVLTATRCRRVHTSN
jgi:hypothetical protein